MKIYWADIHNHNEIGYGKGSLERSYEIATNTLDIYALSAHGHWPDPPGRDAQLIAYHEKGFARVRERFHELKRFANDHYIPGEFVPFIAFEWHSVTWGDYVVLFPGDDGALYPADDIEALRKFASDNEAILIPHHVAYRQGWRGLNSQEFTAEFSPLVEIFSEHGNSLEGETSYPMLGHSMGGSTISQTVLEQLRKGLHFGFTAGTDNHDGYPGHYGQGLTAVLAERLTRESVIEALHKRNTYAVTGDRIELSVSSLGATMGDILSAGDPRILEIDVKPLAPLEHVQIIKNGLTVAMWPGDIRTDRLAEEGYLTRLEWGWDRLGSSEITNWELLVDVKEGEIEKISPCFGGGAASSELYNSFAQESDRRVRVTSHTSRQNPRPVNGMIIEFKGSGDTTIKCQAKAATDSESGGCIVRGTLEQLIVDDISGMPLDRFSSPKIRLGRALNKGCLRFRKQWKDAHPGERDSYIGKAQQKNGQIAWTSPILFQS